MNTYISKEYENGKLRVSDGRCHESYDEKLYEIKMITGNRIPVFLSCRKNYEDDKEEYVYDAKSMTSLSDLSKLKSLTYAELKILIKSINLCQNAIENYLLSGEGLILDPEFVFFDRECKEFKYCYFPWDSEDMYVSYTKMTEFLLSSIDYSDEKAVDAAYSLYASVLNKDYDLMKYLLDEKEDNSIPDKIETISKEDDEDSTTEDLKPEIEQNRDINCVKKHMKASSIVCITIAVVFFAIFTVIFIWSKRLFIYMMGDMRLVSAVVLIFSILLYFPVMDIVSKT